MADGPRGKTELVIGALLFGAMAVGIALAGEPLLAAVKTFMLRRDIEAVQVMVLTYRTTFHRLPGDDIDAPDRWHHRPPARTVTGTGRILDLGGNGRLDGVFLEPGNANAEGYAAWRDLAAAGLWSQDPAQMAEVGLGRVPRHRLGGLSGFAEGLFDGLGPAYCLAGLPGTAARAIDRGMDDGAADTGAVRAAWLPPGWQPPILNQSLRTEGLPFDRDAGVLVCVALDAV